MTSFDAVGTTICHERHFVWGLKVIWGAESRVLCICLHMWRWSLALYEQCVLSKDLGYYYALQNATLIKDKIVNSVLVLVFEHTVRYKCVT